MNYWLFKSESDCKAPGIVGIMEVTREGYPDYTATDPAQHYYDPKSDPDNPRWYMVDVKYIRDLKRTIALRELTPLPELEGMPLVRKGNRLSIMPLNKEHWNLILGME